MIGRMISHYEIVEQIGEGGMGTVFKALDTKLNIHRALKFIHPHLLADEFSRKRFILEAQAASSLDHPNICNIHEVDETESGRPFICMTYYEGETLAKRVDAAPLAAAEFFRIANSIAQGLSCAHQNGIIHRDIKPRNILVTDDGHLKILDFGLVKLAGAVAMTKEGAPPGTVRYMSPEQTSGQETDHRTDIWSLGLIMYELATGQYPFDGDYEASVIYAILNTEPPPAHEVNPNIPEPRSQLINRCLAKDPGQRYQSIEELTGDLGAVAQAEGCEVSFGDHSTSGSQIGTAGRRPVLSRALLVSVLLVAIAALVYWQTSRPPDLFTTELRLAVMPLSNKAHPAQDLVTDGMSEVVYQMLDEASRRRESMWVVPNRLVHYANLAEDSQAKNAFGVNRIITGGLQRFDGGLVLRLVLRDAETLEQIRTARIPYDPLSTVVVDSLPLLIAGLVDLDGERSANLVQYLPASGPATKNYLQGLGALLAGDYPAATTSLTEVTRTTSEFGLGWNSLGWAKWQAYLDTGEEQALAESLKSLEQAVALAPTLWRPLYNLGEVRRQIGEPDAAIEAFRAANRIDADNPLICRRLSDVYRTEQRFTEAEAVLVGARDRRPDYFETPRLLAIYYYRTGEIEAALDRLDEALTLAPNDAFALNTKGVIFMDRGEYARARRQFEQAFALAPNCVTCSNIGYMHYLEDQFGESASYYELSLEYCGDEDPDAWANWARALYWADGERPKSVAKFQTAIALTRDQWLESPGDPIVIGNLIEYHAMVGDAEATRRLIATGDSLATDNAELLYQIGDAYELIGDRISALRYLAKALRYGIPVARIQATRELADLVTDPRFSRMIAAEFGPGDAPADSMK